MQAIANVSILGMFVMYLLTAIFGYLTFYGEPLISKLVIPYIYLCTTLSTKHPNILLCVCGGQIDLLSFFSIFRLESDIGRREKL